MDRNSGKMIDGADHLEQSIGDILTTPIGSRVGRRDYGSSLPALLDQPYNKTLRLRIFAATAAAILRWETRIALKSVGLDRADDGTFLLSITGSRTDVPQAGGLTSISVPLVGALA